MHFRLFSLAASLLGAVACDKPPIEWTEPAPIEQATDAGRLRVDTSGKAYFVADSAQAAGRPTVPGLCAATVVMAPGRSRLHAAWWNVRSDSSSVLYSASSPDSGRTWGAPLAVDTTDVSSTGCNRPPPAIAVWGDDVYLAYSMIAPEGKGVFFAHAMGNMLHTPVPVIYGRRLVATAIDVDSMRVAVAYEEPNGKREQIDVALSGSQGHLFEVHTTASRSVDIARAPAVAFKGMIVAVSWLARRPTETSTTRLVRVGRIVPPN